MDIHMEENIRKKTYKQRAIHMEEYIYKRNIHISYIAHLLNKKSSKHK